MSKFPANAGPIAVWPWKIVQFLRFLLAWLLVAPALKFTRRLQARRDFEWQRLHCLDRPLDKAAAAAFEVSSQGELEQVLPLLEHYMSRGELVELLYCSPSAEKNVAELKVRWGALLQARALPLLTRYLSPESTIEDWVSAPILYMARYDFFPELMQLRHRMRRMVLVSATMINHWPLAHWWQRRYWRFIMRHFDFILASSHADRQRFGALGFPTECLLALEWRLERIVQRLQKSDERLQSRLSLLMLAEYLRQRNGHSLIMGSAWPADIALLEGPEWRRALLGGNVSVVLAPHLLSDEAAAALRDALARYVPGVPVYELRAQESHSDAQRWRSQMLSAPGIVILRMGGVLCESYQFFSHAYVGGGLGRSIHSVLEPWPSCPIIACGPRIHRSTEFEWIAGRTPDRLSVVSSALELWQLLHTRVLARNRVESDLAIALAEQDNDKQQFIHWINHA